MLSRIPQAGATASKCKQDDWSGPFLAMSRKCCAIATLRTFEFDLVAMPSRDTETRWFTVRDIKTTVARCKERQGCPSYANVCVHLLYAFLLLFSIQQLIPYADWKATEGWDAVTGVGTPKWNELVEAVMALP